MNFFGVGAASAQAGLLAMSFFGCSSKVEHATNEVFEQTYKISSDAGVSIRNTDGSIVIHGTETSDLHLRAIKNANSNEEIKNIGISAIAQANSVSITTKFLRQKNQALSRGSRKVDYTVTVPPTVKLTRIDLEDGKVLIDGMRGEELRATVVDGQLAIHDCCGNAQVTVVNGALDLFYGSCDRQQFSVDAQVTNGNARIFVQDGASFRIRAETMTGKVTNHFGDIVDLNGRVTRKVDISTGKGTGPEIKLRVTTGDIKIAKATPESRGAGSNGSQ
jgi:putative adhesin